MSAQIHDFPEKTSTTTNSSSKNALRHPLLTRSGKILFFSICLACTMLLGNRAEAQLQKGYALIGADMANFQVGLNAGHVFNLQLNPKAAWFIANNFAVGAYVQLGAAGSKGTAPITNYGFGPLARYYVNDPAIEITKHTRFFIEANAGFQGTNDANTRTSTNGLGIGFGPGIAHFVTTNVALEALLKYNGIVGFGSNPYQNNLSLNLGLQIYLPGKRVIAAAKGK